MKAPLLAESSVLVPDPIRTLSFSVFRTEEKCGSVSIAQQLGYFFRFCKSSPQYTGYGHVQNNRIL